MAQKTPTLWRRVAAWTAAAFLLFAVAGLAAGGWSLSDVLKRDALMPDHTPSPPDLEVLALAEGLVTLGVTPETSGTGPWKHEGTWGLRWDGGYGQAGPIRQLTEQQVVRAFTPLTGELRPGEAVRLEGAAYQGDPRTALGIDFQEVRYTSPLGAFTAWYIPGTRDAWAIFVHGRNSTPREGLRVLPALVQQGYPILMITYRNDEGAPADPDGFLRYGLTEWQDLEGAVAHALGHGARDVVLVGFSMGGAIVVNFMYQSPQAERVRALILDAPMTNFNATIDLGVEQRGYPTLVAAVAKGFSRVRFGVDWSALDYLKQIDRLRAPILLFHGAADDTVPVATSDALARARPDSVRYVRVPGAVHVGSWNAAPADYEAEVRGFLASLPLPQ
ncbi:MAG: alpha/beta fold hydrolase [Chloroflexi bacterium]|nr:alpha/beta fold hydrolase [Chloroflexota bacterium]